MPKTPEQEREYGEFLAKKERVRRGELCYYCMKRPPTQHAIHAADGVAVVACDECAARQVGIGKSLARGRTGCLFGGIVLLALAALAVKSCF